MLITNACKRYCSILEVITILKRQKIHVNFKAITRKFQTFEKHYHGGHFSDFRLPWLSPWPQGNFPDFLPNFPTPVSFCLYCIIVWSQSSGPRLVDNSKSCQTIGSKNKTAFTHFIEWSHVLSFARDTDHEVCQVHCVLTWFVRSVLSFLAIVFFFPKLLDRG